jgi:hypothetical protein
LREKVRRCPCVPVGSEPARKEKGRSRSDPPPNVVVGLVSNHEQPFSKHRLPDRDVRGRSLAERDDAETESSRPCAESNARQRSRRPSVSTVTGMPAAPAAKRPSRTPAQSGGTACGRSPKEAGTSAAAGLPPVRRAPWLRPRPGKSHRRGAVASRAGGRLRRCGCHRGVTRRGPAPARP